MTTSASSQSTSTSTTATTSSSSSTSTSTASTSCSTSTGSGPADVVPLLSVYSAMSLQYNETSSSSSSSTSTPSSVNFTLAESFSTVYVSSTTYKINMNFSETTGGQTDNAGYTVWVLKSGTIVAVYVPSAGPVYGNTTGAQAAAQGPAIFAGFIAQVEANQALGTYTDQSYFHSTGTSSVAIGPTKVTVTNYVADSLPETMNFCDGSSSTLTSYALSVGTPPGASGPLVTYELFGGSSVGANGQTSTFEQVIQVTSVTLA